MIERLAERINEIVFEHSTSIVAQEYLSRVKKGKLTRDENPHSHFCVYFAGYDPEVKKVFIGHHKNQVYGFLMVDI